MKKKTASTTRTTGARTPKIEPPAGLVAAFSMINPEGVTPINALARSREALPYALELIELLHGYPSDDGEQEAVIEKFFTRATNEVFPDWDDPEPASENPSMRAEVAYHIGFCACWRLMTSINGGAR